MTEISEDPPEAGEGNDEDLRPTTWLEKHGFKLFLAGVAVVLFGAGLIVG